MKTKITADVARKLAELEVPDCVLCFSPGGEFRAELRSGRVLWNLCEKCADLWDGSVEEPKLMCAPHPDLPVNDVAFHSAIAWREYSSFLEHYLINAGHNIPRVASDKLRTEPPSLVGLVGMPPATPVQMHARIDELTDILAASVDRIDGATKVWRHLVKRMYDECGSTKAEEFIRRVGAGEHDVPSPWSRR